MSNDFNELMASAINRPAQSGAPVFSHHHSNKPNSLKHKYLAAQQVNANANAELSPLVLEPRPPSFGKPKRRDNSASGPPRRHRFAKASDAPSFLSTTPSPVPPLFTEHSDESMDLNRRPRTRLNDDFIRPESSSPHRRSRSKSRSKRDQEEVIELLNRTTINNRPLSSRLSKYTEPLPQIGQKFTTSHKKAPHHSTHDPVDTYGQQRSTSSSSVLLSTSTFNDADTDMEDPAHLTLLIGIRLPDGRRLHCQVPPSTPLLKLVQQGVEELRRRDTSADPESSAYALLQMPNLLYRDLEHSLESFSIEDRTMFFLINKQNL